ncbi:MAG: SusC/RagA family protein, partial [Bacteroidota bacterium]
GIFQSQAEVDAWGQEGAQVGGLKFADLNGDGQITEDGDVGIIGSPHPDFTLGVNLSLGYKRFDLTAFFLAVVGNEISNQTRAFTHLRQFNGNITQEVLENAWSEDNTDSNIPALNAVDNSSNFQSTYYIEDGSYLRAKQVQLGYSVPANAIKGVSNLRFYIQGQNLFTITGYSGADPAISNVNQGNGGRAGAGSANDQWTGFDHGMYPASMIVMFGVNASF